MEDQAITEAVEQTVSEQPAKLTTYSGLQNDLATFETKEAETQQATDTPTEVQAENTTTEAPAPVQETTEVELDANVSNFSLGGEGVPEAAVEPTVTQPTFNLDEEIKKVDRKDLLKKAGVSDFAIEMDEYLAKGGNAADYLNAKAIDYNKISDEELIKNNLKTQFPNLSPEEISRKFNRKYGISDDLLEDEIEDRNIELKADGFKIRQEKIEEQKKFKIPDTPILHKDEAYEQWKEQQESQSKLNEQGKQWFLQHEATKTLNESKRVTISLGEGVPPFNFSVDRPDLITQVLTDGGETWNKLTSTKTGEPDVQKQQLLSLIAYNPQQFANDIFRYGMQLGERKLVADGQNAVKPQAIVAPIDANATPSYKTGKYGGGTR